MAASISTITRTIQRDCRWQSCLQRSSDAYTISSASSCVNQQLRTQQHHPSCATFSTSTDSTTKDAITIQAVDDTNNNRSRILSLYRSIRRIHETSLPANLRDMGNKYLQSEFRTLKDTTKMTPKHFQNFMSEWEKYRQQLLQSQKESKFGQPLPSDVQLTAEQHEQLRKLQQEVTSTNHTATTDTDNKLG